MNNTNINLNALNAKTVLASTFSQVAYLNEEQLGSYAPPAGFERLPNINFSKTSLGFSAETFVNKSTGEVVIAYRGSDTVGEAVNIAAKAASTGTWNPQFTDATNYAKQATAVALKTINEYRDQTKQPRLEDKDLTPLITGHSLGGLLGQVVSKMFGWPAEVFDSLGAGKLINTKEYAEQAKALGQVDEQGNVINHDVSDKITNYATSTASLVGTQLGSTVNIPALGQVGGMGAVASMLAFLVSPVAGVVSLLTQQEIAQHGKLAIEQAMYGLAALKPLVSDQGALHAQNMSLAQATGQIVPEGSTSPGVIGLVNAQGQVVAYVGRDGNAAHIVVTLGSKAGTTLSLGRTGADENASIQIIQTNPDQSQKTLSQTDLLRSLKIDGRDVISNQIFDDGSRIITTTSADGQEITMTYDSKGVVCDRVSDLKVFNDDGSLQRQSHSHNSNYGKSVFTQYDYDGDGDWDSTVDFKRNADGSGTTDYKYFKADGTLAAAKQTVDSADKYSNTTLQDYDGDGDWDNRSVSTTLRDGSSLTISKVLKADGSVSGESITTISADKKTSTTYLDMDADGHCDSSTVTTTGSDGGQMTVNKSFKADDSLSSMSISTLSGDRKSSSELEDTNGDGRWDHTTERKTNSDGSRIETENRYQLDGSLKSYSELTHSADGKTRTHKSDDNGDGRWDYYSVTETLADGSTITDSKDFKANGSVSSVSQYTSSADGNYSTAYTDFNGDGYWDRSNELTIDEHGAHHTIDKTYYSDGSLASEERVSIGAGYKWRNILSDTDGDGIWNDTSVYRVNADGSRFYDYKHFKDDGALRSEQQLTYSPDSKLSVKLNDLNADGSWDNGTTSQTLDDGGRIVDVWDVRPDNERTSHQAFDASGELMEMHTVAYDRKKGITEMDVYQSDSSMVHTTIEGHATAAQLDKALSLSEEIANATSFVSVGKSQDGESFLDTLGILDERLTEQATVGTQSLAVADDRYSGNNLALAPVFSALSDYAVWLQGRGTMADTRTDIVADPSLLGLQDGPLTLVLARQNPNPVNVLRALQNVVLAGGVMSESFKQGVADQLGTNTTDVNKWIASGGAAITSFLQAMDQPTVANVATAALSMLNAGQVISPALTQTFADKMGVSRAQFGEMLAYGGAGLAVASALKNPTPESIVAATQQVTGILGAMHDSASLQNLSYTLGNAPAVFSVYNFAKNPNKQTAVSAMLSVAMRIPSLAPYAVPLAAALTIGEMIIPGFTDKAVDALVHGIPGVAFDAAKGIIKVDMAIVEGTLNLAGSVVEVVGGVINSVGDVVSGAINGVGDVVGGVVEGAGNLIGGGAKTVVNAVQEIFSWTPLVLNLADDPVHTTTLNSTSPLFDLSGDGIAERTGWITPDEGFLVRDLNGNGKIDGIKEMFSERTSRTASTAFGALAELDRNKDGVISSTDEYWSTLKIWVDKNSDGKTQGNELYTLAQLGIASIKLNPTQHFAYDNGNIIGDKSTFTYTDGRVGQMADAFFTTQQAKFTDNFAQTLMTHDSTTVRLSNGQTMKVLDVHGQTMVVGSATEGLNVVTSTGGNNVTAADDANGLTLIGERNDTLLSGKGHAVVLVSQGGAKLVGNSEDNLYVVSETTDVIQEQANAGIDTVLSSASYSLPAHLENLTLTGTAPINGTGNSLNNVMEGNAANNVLNGGAGNDTYAFGRGAGHDTLIDTDSTAGNSDVIRVGPGVSTDQLWFRHVGNDLEISILGTDDKEVVQNWYLGSQHQMERIRTSDGKVLANTDVDKLVQAMASFAPPASGTSVLPTAYQTAMAPVIAANWH